MGRARKGVSFKTPTAIVRDAVRAHDPRKRRRKLAASVPEYGVRIPEEAMPAPALAAKELSALDSGKLAADLFECLVRKLPIPETSRATQEFQRAQMVHDYIERTFDASWTRSPEKRYRFKASKVRGRIDLLLERDNVRHFVEMKTVPSMTLRELSVQYNPAGAALSKRGVPKTLYSEHQIQLWGYLRHFRAEDQRKGHAGIIYDGTVVVVTSDNKLTPFAANPAYDRDEFFGEEKIDYAAILAPYAEQMRGVSCLDAVPRSATLLAVPALRFTPAHIYIDSDGVVTAVWVFPARASKAERARLASAVNVYLVASNILVFR